MKIGMYIAGERVAGLKAVKTLSTAICTVAVIGAVTKGLAQDSEFQDVSPNVSVSERFADIHGADGLRSGGFLLFPSLSISEVYDDNVFSEPEATGPVDDFLTDVSGRLRARSDWSRHGIEASARVRRLQFHEQRRESNTEYAFAGNGFLNLGARSRFLAGAGYRRASEPRSATQTVAGSNEPVRFSTTTANADFDLLHTRFREQFGVSYRKDDFDDALVASALVDQDFRDRDIYSAYYRQSFRFRPTIAVFAEASGEIQEYDTVQPGVGALQDSTSYRVSGGVAADINKVARGEIALGYQNRDYDDPVFTDVSGFSVEAGVEYFLSDLTTVTVNADRSIRDTAVPGVAGFYSTGGDVTIEHELFRPLLLVASAAYREDDFRGIDRKDDILSFAVGADYAFRPEAILSVRYTHLDVGSDGLAARAPFTDNVIRFGIELRL
ncbi:MAG: outer membrane beta-barrel protein [Pseudomonadota bacterium]